MAYQDGFARVKSYTRAFCLLVPGLPQAPSLFASECRSRLAKPARSDQRCRRPTHAIRHALEVAAHAKRQADLRADAARLAANPEYQAEIRAVELLGQDARVLVEQTTAVDPQRLGDFAGRLAPDELMKINVALRAVLDLD